MIWNDRRIKRMGENKLIIPFNPELVQPNSYDITLADGIYVNDEWTRLPYEIKKGDFVLASTVEYFKIGDTFCAQVDGKSTLGRKGLIVHQTAGWIDSGFEGNITLEMTCVYKPILLTEGMRIGQIVFMDSYVPETLYHGHYQGQKGATKPAL